jgi:hypothetical protein
MARNYGLRRRGSVEQQLRATEWKVLCATFVVLLAIPAFVYIITM